MSDMTKAYGQIINIVNNKAKSCLELTSFDGYCKAVFAFYYNDSKMRLKKTRLSNFAKRFTTTTTNGA